MAAVDSVMIRDGSSAAFSGCSGVVPAGRIFPERFPSYQTCHRRFQQWQADGTFEGIVFTLDEELRAKGRFELRDAPIDGSFRARKRGALQAHDPERSAWMSASGGDRECEPAPS
jgi:hypothetical protein